MEILKTLNNIFVISLGFIIFVRIILWYFKKDSPFMNTDFSIFCSCMVFIMISVANLASYAKYGEQSIESTTISTIFIGFYIVVNIASYLLKLRDRLPDTRTNKDKDKE